jgi:hypothetical protein
VLGRALEVMKSRGVEICDPEAHGSVRAQPRNPEARARHERIECLAVVLVGAFRPAGERYAASNAASTKVSKDQLVCARCYLVGLTSGIELIT